MQFYALIAALAATAIASPVAGGDKSSGGSGSSSVCPALYTPQCCETDVAGLVGLTCNSPDFSVTSKDKLVKDCASEGKTGQCCLLNQILGQSLVCEDP